MIDEHVREIQPVRFREQFHEILLDLHRITAFSQAESGCQPRHVRIHDNANNYAIGVAKYDVCRFARNSGQSRQFVHRTWHFAVVSLDYSGSRAANVASLVAEEAGLAVIDETAFRKILDYIEVGKSEGSLVLGGTRAGNEGYFINPTIFSEVSSRARIAQEEIFGPVLACIRARDFSHAIEIANATEYGLTGSLFSTDRDRIREANERFHVGNLYVNRKCTGALVGVHPFGGFNMSGTDSKAGGRDYLLLFTQAKVISEKVS